MRERSVQTTPARDLTEPFARHFALRYRNSSWPLDDLVQVAMLGLVNTIDRYARSRARSSATPDASSSAS
jgi:DNA-directed RNA polymerase specialized sigma subunit